MSNWIADATSQHKGLFRSKAEKAGESTSEYASEKKDAPGALGKEARLASTLMHLGGGGKKGGLHNIGKK